MVHFVIAMPRLAPDDAARLHAIRDRYQAPYRDALGPHVTLVFASRASLATLVAEVERVAAAFPPIVAELRDVRAVADPLSTDTYLFLEPDATAARAFVAMHDALHAGPLAGELRADLPYRPHVTIGRSGSSEEMARAARELSDAGTAVAATFTALTIVSLDGDRVAQVADRDLRAAAGP
jgi:2'-5' RNA ligase